MTCQGRGGPRHATLDHRTCTSEVLLDGTTRHIISGQLIPTPPEYAAVYGQQRRPAHSAAALAFDPTSLWPYEPREPHRAHVRDNGYFWRPCPLRGREFGDHEIGDSITLPDSPAGITGGICPRRTAEHNSSYV